MKILIGVRSETTSGWRNKERPMTKVAVMKRLLSTEEKEVY